KAIGSGEGGPSEYLDDAREVHHALADRHEVPGALLARGLVFEVDLRDEGRDLLDVQRRVEVVIEDHVRRVVVDAHVGVSPLGHHGTGGVAADGETGMNLQRQYDI